MSEKKRRKIMMDWGRWQTVLKHTRQSSKPSTVAVLVAMENVCFEQRARHSGNAFVGSYPFLATMSGVHEDTVRNVVELLKTLGVVKVKGNYDVRRKQYSENYYTLLAIGGGGGGGKFQGGVMESEATSESVALSKEKGEASISSAADAASSLALRDIEASRIKSKAEQLAEAEQNRKQHGGEAVELAERNRLLAEKEKADKEAAQLAEDARRLAKREDVGSCRQAIMQASFDEYDAGTFATVWSDYNEETVMAAVARLPNVWAEKVVACMRNNTWMFETEAK